MTMMIICAAFVGTSHSDQMDDQQVLKTLNHSTVGPAAAAAY